MITHEETKELLGVYALDAVDDDERRMIRAHLAICRACRTEVDRHRSVAARLAEAGDTAPSDVWERIEASLIDGEPATLESLALTTERPSGVCRVGVARGGHLVPLRPVRQITE